MAEVAAVSLGLARVDVDVALADLAGCRTGGIGTEYVVRVHEVLSGLVVGRILLGPATNISSTHGYGSQLSAHLPNFVKLMFLEYQIRPLRKS